MDMMIAHHGVMMAVREASPLLAESLATRSKMGKKTSTPRREKSRPITSLGVLTSTQHSILRDQVLESVSSTRVPVQFAETK